MQPSIDRSLQSIASNMYTIFAFFVSLRVWVFFAHWIHDESWIPSKNVHNEIFFLTSCFVTLIYMWDMRLHNKLKTVDSVGPKLATEFGLDEMIFKWCMFFDPELRVKLH